MASIGYCHAQTMEEISKNEEEINKLSKNTILALEQVQVVLGFQPKEPLAEISNCVSHLIAHRKLRRDLDNLVSRYETEDEDSPNGREYIEKKNELFRNQNKARGHIQRARLDLYKVVWVRYRRFLEFAHNHPFIFSFVVNDKDLRALIRKNNEKDFIELARKAEAARIEESKNINSKTEASIAKWKEAVQNILDYDEDTTENQIRFHNIKSAMEIETRWDMYRKTVIMTFTSFASAAISFGFGILL